MRTIEAGALRLEPQVEAHAEAMFAVLADPAIYEFENAPPESLAWLRDRCRRLESRRSPDGRERWLNWVIRLPSGELAGYVQATVHPDAHAGIAYELASRHWGQGIARAAVQAMLRELSVHYGVRRFTAVLKAANFRSHRLLVRLGFSPASPESAAGADLEADERLMDFGPGETLG